MTEDPLITAMRQKSSRQVMAEFVFALGQLVIHHQLGAEVTDLAINFHGRALRVDIATLTADGQHLEQWVLGLNANMADQDFGAPVSLPVHGPVQ